jgi:hypothetical protein
MKRENIVKKLEKMGYEVTLGKYKYWEVPHVGRTAIATTDAVNNAACVNMDLKYDDVLAAIKGEYDSVDDYLKHVETGVDMRKAFDFEDDIEEDILPESALYEEENKWEGE